MKQHWIALDDLDSIAIEYDGAIVGDQNLIIRFIDDISGDIDGITVDDGTRDRLTVKKQVAGLILEITLDVHARAWQHDHLIPDEVQVALLLLTVGSEQAQDE